MINETLSTERDEQLSDHLKEFMQLSKKLDTAVRQKKTEEVVVAKEELDVFFGQLDAEKQTEIRMFLERQNAGQRIQEYRSWTQRAINGVLQFPVVVMKNAADTIPELTAETIRLIMKTIGYASAGVYRGGVEINNAFRKAA